MEKLDDREIVKKLAALKKDLADIENEKSFISKQSGMHVSSTKVISQMEEFDSEISILKKKIAECCEEIGKRGFSD